MPNMAKLGDIERRWSYASWTAPSHFNLLMGLLPHQSPTHVYASEYYKRDFARYAERLGVPGIEFSAMLPSLWLPTYLRNVLGYRTGGVVSMPVLNPKTPINRDFDDYALMDRHNHMAGVLDRLHFDPDRPSFWLLNVGETHYPYALPDEDPEEWPRISGVHGVFKHLDDADGPDEPAGFFDADQLDRLRQRQMRAASFVDDLLQKLYDLVPPRTWLIVTSDHGELFGEGARAAAPPARPRKPRQTFRADVARGADERRSGPPWGQSTALAARQALRRPIVANGARAVRRIEQFAVASWIILST